MRQSVPRCLCGCVTIAILACYAGPARAQSKLLQNLDTNKDGKVSRDEIPEGPTRRMFDNMVEKFKLDPKKTYTIQELEQLTGLGSPAGSSNSSAGSSSPPSRFSGPRRTSSPSRPGVSTRAPSDGRPFRALEELPEPYRSYDKNGDGQIGLYEWPRDRIREFIALDVNDDGFLTINELRKSSPGGAETSRDKKEDSSSPSSEQGDR